MIYDTNFMRKEFRNAYMQQQFSRQRQMSIGVFLGLLAFAVFFSLQTLKQSVINDVAPQLMMSSYFSTLYLYLFIALIFNVVFYIANYDYMTFIEVIRNRWYALVQLGYSPSRLIMQKIIVRILSQTAIFSIGYIATIFLSSFLKFPIVLSYIISLYVMGLIDIVLLAAISLTVSLFLRDTTNARYIVGLLAVGLLVFKAVSGYYSILADRTLMNDMSNMFDITQSVFMSVSAFIILACIGTCLLIGNKLARVYNPPLLHQLPALTCKAQGTVVLNSSSAGAKKKPLVEAGNDPLLSRTKRNIPSIIMSILMVCAIIALLGLNVVVLACGYASPERETSINGVIPYVFQSSTMEPAIMFNDLAFFQKVDGLSQLHIGDILLYKDQSGGVNVAGVQAYTKDESGQLTGGLDVDVLNYVDDRYRGLAAQTIARDQVYGVHTSNNRWLGAVILFANTILGRLVLLLIPTFLIFFYEPILRFFRGLSKEKS
jgi:hypothetical protein